MKKNYTDIPCSLPHDINPPIKQQNSPSIDEAVQHINEIDFSLIREKLCSGDILLCRTWSSVEVEIGLQYYKNFLFLNKKYLGEFPILPPTLEVDEIWHHHILDTRQYIKDCKKIFGYYFHHYPYFGTRSPTDKENLSTAFDVTQMLHEREFGSKMLALWSDEIEL